MKEQNYWQACISEIKCVMETGEREFVGSEQ